MDIIIKSQEELKKNNADYLLVVANLVKKKKNFSNQKVIDRARLASLLLLLCPDEADPSALSLSTMLAS